MIFLSNENTLILIVENIKSMISYLKLVNPRGTDLSRTQTCYVPVERVINEVEHINTTLTAIFMSTDFRLKIEVP